MPADTEKTCIKCGRTGIRQFAADGDSWVCVAKWSCRGRADEANAAPPADSTSSASMGEPLSEAEREHMNLTLTGQLRRIATGEHEASQSMREYARMLVAERERESLSRRCERYFKELEQATARVGVLEGQLATARAELERQRWYGEQLQVSIEGCSGNHDDILGWDEEPEPRDLGHEFLPVNGHPDDDECTHRTDGTDDTYCGEPKAAHGSALGLDGGGSDAA